MARDILIRLSDAERFTAIRSLRLTQRALDGEDLIPGGACAAVLEAELYGTAPISRGTELKYLRDGISLGIFRVEEARQVSQNRYRITAYDRMILFDRDVTDYWNSLLPARGRTALEKLCKWLGVRKEDFTIPSETLQPLEVTAVTGRQLLKWLGQRWGMYFYMDELGGLRGEWFRDRGTALGDYRLDGLTLAAYETAPVERVWVRQTETDVGTVYPDGLEDTANTLILQGNPLTPDPKKVYDLLSGFPYRPFRCAVLEAPYLGDVVTLPDGSKAPVTERILENGIWTVAATGNPTLQCTAAWNSLDFSDLRGRVLTVEKSMDGLRVANADNAGKLAELTLTAEELNTRVEQNALEGRTHAEASAVTSLRSQLTQRADGLEFSVTQVRTGLGDKADRENIREVTEHFRFDLDGLTITNTGTGMGIGISEQRVIFTGGHDPTTVIYPNSLETAAMTVHETLTLGAFSLIPRTNGNVSLRYTGGN